MISHTRAQRSHGAGSRSGQPNARRFLGIGLFFAIVLAGAFPAAVWGLGGPTAHRVAASSPAGPFVRFATTGPPLARFCTAHAGAAATPLPGASSGGAGGMEAPGIGFRGLTHNTAQANFGGDISGAAGSGNYVETI